MPKIQRIREALSGPPAPDYLAKKAEAGWKLVAVEWERELKTTEQGPGLLIEEVPFGLRVANDCLHLEENPTEKQILVMMMDLIVQDSHLSKVAEELNRQGFRTREGSKWSQRAVFNMLPRLIEAGPQIFSSDEWEDRRQRLARVL